MKIETTCCPYCGQYITLETIGEVGEEKLQELAAEQCECGGAKEARRKKQQREKLEKNICKLFGETFPEASDLLIAAICPIQEYNLAAIQIDTGLGIKAKLSVNQKGEIKVEKSETKKQVLQG